MNKPQQNELNWEVIQNRNGIPTYRIQIPNHWKRVELSFSQDTRDPIAKWNLSEGLSLVIHSFPLRNIETHIPPEAQVARWKQQDGDEQSVTRPTSFGGYIGIEFEGDKILAWALQIAPVHWSRFDQLDRAADITIKASGPIDHLDLNREEIQQAVRSFQLIWEIPKP